MNAHLQLLDDLPPFLTLSQAARLAGRSYSWVQDRVTEKALEAHKPAVGPMLVTSASLRALLASRRCRQLRGPTLVWTNPNL